MSSKSSNSRRKKWLHRQIQEGSKQGLKVSSKLSNSNPAFANRFINRSPFEIEISEKVLTEERKEYLDHKEVESLKGLNEVLNIAGIISISAANKIDRDQLRAEAKYKNLYMELAALMRNQDVVGFNAGRRDLFLAVGEMIEYGNQKYPASIEEKIRAAGVKLNQSGGDRDMHDVLVWSFIPKPLHRVIDHLWDGIGNWKA